MVMKNMCGRYELLNLLWEAGRLQLLSAVAVVHEAALLREGLSGA